MVHVDEHLKVSENVLQGPNRKAVSITIDDDFHIDEDEEYRKNENFGKDFHQTPPSVLLSVHLAAYTADAASFEGLLLIVT
nr:tracheary element differentiation-related 6 [Tanacetum cinerariifolium]